MPQSAHLGRGRIYSQLARGKISLIKTLLYETGTEFCKLNMDAVPERIGE
jgi:hypothetical protein